MLAEGEARRLELTCATQFSKSFQPIAPMVRVGGDPLHVSIALGCLSGHGNSGTDAIAPNPKVARGWGHTIEGNQPLPVIGLTRKQQAFPVPSPLLARGEAKRRA